MLNNIKLGTKLLVICALLVAVPLIAVTYISVVKASSAVVSVGNAGLRREARFVASGLNHSMQQEQLFVGQLAAKASVVGAIEAVAAGGAEAAKSQIATANDALKETAKEDASSNHETMGYMAIDTRGVVVAANNSDDLGRDFASSAFFQQALKGHDAFGEVSLDLGDQDAQVPVAAPIFSSNGRIIGVLQEQLSLQFIQQLVANATVGKTGYAFVLDRLGMTIAHKDKSYVMKLNMLKTNGMQTLGKDLLSGRQGVASYFFNGSTNLAGFAPVKATGWGVGLTVPQAEYLAPVTAFRDLAIVISVIALVLAIFILILFVRSITNPLSKAVDYARTVAEGDFTHQLNIHRKDEVGILTGSLNNMVDRLKDMIAQIRDASLHVASSSEEITASAQQLSAGAQNQASTLEETSASVEELTASVEQVSDHAQSQAASVEESSSNMSQMESSVEQVSKTLTNVSSSSKESMGKAESGAEAVRKAVEAINNISKSSEEIAGIINVISDIADQTNLLALNASIEAARAGEHGRGFAVVADEVSKLADRSSSSTKEIENLIRESSKDVNSGVEIAQAALTSMDEIIRGARSTNEMVEALSADIEQQINAIKELAKATESISEMSQSISAATEEQTTNAKQVAKAIENVNELTQQAAGAAEEMSATTEELSALAQQMQRLVEFFRLNETAGGQELPSPRAWNAPAGTNGQNRPPNGQNGHANGNGNGRRADAAIGGNGNNGAESGNGFRDAGLADPSVRHYPEANVEETRITVKNGSNGDSLHA